MVTISLKELLEAGVHFGHQTKKRNPKMKKYIYNERNGIHIIDLQQTIRLFDEASRFISNATAGGKSVLFVGTKKQAQDAIAEEATRAGMSYVNQRWLGGLLTNFVTLKKSIKKFKELEKMKLDGDFEHFSKKDASKLEKKYRKMEKLFQGIKNMENPPDLLFVIDPRKEGIAVSEARKSKVPIVPVAISGSRDIMPKGKWTAHPGEIRILLAPPIVTENCSMRDRKALMEKVNEMISRTFRLISEK